MKYPATGRYPRYPVGIPTTVVLIPELGTGTSSNTVLRAGRNTEYLAFSGRNSYPCTETGPGSRFLIVNVDRDLPGWIGTYPGTADLPKGILVQQKKEAQQQRNSFHCFNSLARDTGVSVSGDLCFTQP
eukprot:1398384-Rhodomonas_salina.2